MEEEKLQRKKRRAKAENNLELLASTHKKLGDFYHAEGRSEEALEEYEEEKKIWLGLGKAIEGAIANRRIGEIYSTMGEFKEALKHLREYFEVAQEEDDLVEQQRALATIGRSYFFKAESIAGSDEQEYGRSLREAKQAYMLSLKMCDKLNNVDKYELLQMRSRLMLNMGLVFECQGEIDKAVEYIDQAIAVNKRADLYEDLYRCYASMAALQHRQKQPSLSLKYHDLAVDVAERLPEKAQLICETLLSKSEVYFSQANYQGAKQALTRAYKLTSVSSQEKAVVEKYLKAAILLCETEEKLMQTPDGEFEVMKKLYETMGDTCCFVKNYEKAVTYYLKMLECAETVGCCGKDLLPALVSVSQTYIDAGLYDKALEYLNRELEVWKGDDRESCKTSLNIVQLLEQKGDSFENIMTAINRAHSFALKTQDEKLELKVLKRMKGLQEQHGKQKEAEETDEKIKAMQLYCSQASSEEEAEEVEEGTPDLIDDVALPDVLERPTSTHEEPHGSRQTRKQSHAVKLKRNEKGETQLQVACIAGNYQRVKQLIDLGHPVNVTDNGGWTPLHEVCNHGHEELVSLLLDHGANINDPGGDGCEGVTPLHDACSNGHLRIVQTLLDRGALIDVRTNDNSTPLDFLMEWASREQNLPPDDQELFESLRDRLKRGLEKAGHNPVCGDSVQKRLSDPFEKRSREACGFRRGSENYKKKAERKRTDNRFSWDDAGPSCSPALRSDENDMSGPFDVNSNADDSDTESIPRFELDKDADVDPTMEYRDVIQSLRKKKVQEVIRKPMDQSSRGGVFLDVEDVGDDWLIDDVGNITRPTRRRKRKLSEVDGTTFIGPSMRRSGENDIGVSSATSDVSDTETVCENMNVDNNDIVASPTPTPATKKHHSTLHQPLLRELGFSAVTVEQSHQENGTYKSPEASYRTCMQSVKVCVEGKSLLVPIPGNEGANLTFGWLAKEAAKRYSKLEGREPSLILHTSDGAILAPDDPISMINDNRELTTTVTGWKTAPLIERYKHCCDATKTDPSPLIQDRLQSCDITGELNLSKCTFYTDALMPVLRALQHQNSMKHLILASNMLLDDGVKLICDIKELPLLETLDLSCCGITSTGLSLLCEFISSCKMLTVLNLNYNDFEDGWVESIHKASDVIRCLKTLHLRYCSMNSDEFESWNGPYPPVCFGGLEDLDISFNPLGSKGVRSFLTGLQPALLVKLRIAGTSLHNSSCLKDVIDCLGRCPPSNLLTLDLSDNDATDSELLDILRCFDNTNSLRELNLSNNCDLSPVSLFALTSASYLPPSLDLTGCSGLLCSDGKVLPSPINCNLMKRLNAMKLTIMEEEKETVAGSIKELWKQVWGEKGRVQCGRLLMECSVIDNYSDTENSFIS